MPVKGIIMIQNIDLETLIKLYIVHGQTIALYTYTCTFSDPEA